MQVTLGGNTDPRVKQFSKTLPVSERVYNVYSYHGYMILIIVGDSVLPLDAMATPNAYGNIWSFAVLLPGGEDCKHPYSYPTQDNAMVKALNFIWKDQEG